MNNRAAGWWKKRGPSGMNEKRLHVLNLAGGHKPSSQHQFCQLSSFCALSPPPPHPPPKPRTDDAKTTQAHRAYGPIRHKPTVYWLHSWLGGYYSLLSVQCCGSGPFIDRIHLFKTFGYGSRFRRLLCIITNVWIQVHWWCENLS